MTAIPLPVPLERSWRQDAAKIIEELFPHTSPKYWNLLLDLRAHLLEGIDWNRTLDLFLECRQQLEVDHYLPFYRLRRLLTSSLQLEACHCPLATTSNDESKVLCPLAELWRHRSLRDIYQAAHRDWFEHAKDDSIAHHLSFNVVECPRSR